uniref:Calmodulin n=1 Tax=Pseudo-nitzschia australis TaxID=44445 RepID=A0A7S4EIR9_9STRA|mmetsp:Transcript_5529/g.10702  ORF Transcript_5529/g.10702 Transcript_5529/m.10702 type:complete len:743 (-) Transcript_5529:377-2605(-)
MAKSAISTPTTVVVLLVLGLLHAGIVVESFSSSSKALLQLQLQLQPTQSAVTGSQHQSTTTTITSTAITEPLHHFRSSPVLRVATTGLAAETEEETEDGGEEGGLPELGPDGLWHITNEAEYKAVLENNKDKLIVLKVFAPWCKACKGLAPKFQRLVNDKTYQNLPIVWADLNIQGNKDFVKSIGVLALPTVQLYAGDGVKTDTFPCGPSKVPILKRKLIKLVNDHVDAKTRTLKSAVSGYTSTATANDAVTVNATAVSNEAANGTVSVPSVTTKDTAAKVAAAAVSNEVVPAPATAIAVEPREFEPEETIKEVIEREKSTLRNVKYLSEMLESEYEELLTKANLLTFEAGSIVMREGNIGRTFYIILEGEVEICQRTSFEDPLTTPPSYLGTVINQFTNKGDFFGERALITGEPRAASIRASSRTKCLTFDKGSFPKTCILSGFSTKISPADKQQEIEDINDKYGVAFTDIGNIKDEKQYRESLVASQVRGSVNSPRPIAGVDNDEEEDDQQSQQQQQPPMNIAEDPSALGVGTETMVNLLIRLKLIRSITRCFDYTVKYKLKFGDPGSRRRRNILVSKLAPMQRTYIEDAFKLIDDDGSEEINLMELRRVMDSVGESKSDAELLDVIESAQPAEPTKKAISYAPWQDNNKNNNNQYKTITKDDFFGLMAESETYQLFIDTFKTLDPQDAGFVRARDLDAILCGVRDLISDDRKSIIDVEDDEMMVDYEQFSRMLLGTALK